MMIGVLNRKEPGSCHHRPSSLVDRSDPAAFDLHIQMNAPGGRDSEGQVLHLIDETPVSLVTSTVKQVAAKKKVTPKQVWKNLAKVAAEIKSPNPFWSHVG
jgi:hypothetical protein